MTLKINYFEHCPSGKTQHLLYKRLGGPQGWSGWVGKISPYTRNLFLACPFHSKSVKVIQWPNNNYVDSFLITGTNSREKWTHMAGNDKGKLLISRFWKVHHILFLQVWYRQHCSPGELPNCSHRHSPSAESTTIWTWVQASSGVSKRPAPLPA